MKATEALNALKLGNEKFCKATAEGRSLIKKVCREDMSKAQKPFAVVLGCSDSRVPAELIFDQGFGDLFVIRVAGNIVAPSQIGSIEFACQQFGTELVVVLGHTQCGAVTATVDSLLTDPDHISPNLAAIVERVKPAVAPVLEREKGASREQILSLAGHANVNNSVAGLRSGSPIIEELVNSGKLRIIGAEYTLESGAVTFFE